MFPSGNSDNTFESLFKRTFVCDQIQNPISKQDDPSFFSNFPSPFFDEHELPLNQILSQNHQMHTGNTALLTDDQIDDHQSTLDSSGKESSTTKFSIIEASNMKAKAPDLTTTSNVQGGRRRSFSGAVPAPRKRTGKKDRHSKICTAQGVRDRRMRLSLQVARKFFDLQDMLGYDKASKTIEWLFNKSKKAIKELAKDHPQAKNTSNISTDAKSESFVSECEVVSGIEENSNTDFKESVTAPKDVRKLTMNEKGSERKSRKTASNKPNMRESRDEARARARCRTREKMMKKRVEILSQFWHKLNPNHSHDIQKLGSSNNIIPFEAVEESNSSHNQERFSSYSADYHNLADVGTIEKLLGTSTNTSSTSCPISDYQCSAAVSSCIDINNSFLGFLGNWDLLNNHKTNVNQYAVTNQSVSVAGNPNSIFLASPTFPFHQ